MKGPIHDGRHCLPPGKATEAWTPEELELEQLRYHAALTFDERLTIVERLSRLAHALQEERIRKGLPTQDQYAGRK